MKEKWQIGEYGPKFQLVGDNWDTHIVPEYITTQQKTVSIHLSYVIAVEDGITPIRQKLSLHIMTNGLYLLCTRTAITT